MGNQQEGQRDLTMEFQIFHELFEFILSMLAGNALSSWTIIILPLGVCVSNVATMNFERLVSSQKPPREPPEKIYSIIIPWFKLVVDLLYLYWVPQNKKRFVLSIFGSGRFNSIRFTIVDYFIICNGFA